MRLPNYVDGSIVNLVSSIGASYGLDTQYGNLRSLDPDWLSEYDKIVLMVIDGLGKKYLDKNQQNSFIGRNARSSITSVFPTTTSAGITSFSTGVAPQQHAVTGWFMYLKEMGMITKILPFMPRVGGMKLSDVGIDHSMLIGSLPIYDRMPVSSYCILKEDIAGGSYSSFISGSSSMMPFSDLEGFFGNIVKACNSAGERRYIYSYWSHFDTLCHLYGVDSEEVHKHFNEIDKGLERLCEELDGTNTCILMTADHGQINVDDGAVIDVADHPTLYDSLALPFSGESRAAYCYVRPSKVKAFERYVEDELSDVCDLMVSSEMVDSGFFGLYDANEKLYDRIGDYTLLMKENYVIRDRLLGEDRFEMRGYHGGLSEEELYVPLLQIGL